MATNSASKPWESVPSYDWVRELSERAHRRCLSANGPRWALEFVADLRKETCQTTRCVGLYVGKYVYVYVYMYVYIYIYICMYVYTYIYIYVYIYLYIFVCVCTPHIYFAISFARHWHQCNRHTHTHTQQMPVPGRIFGHKERKNDRFNRIRYKHIFSDNGIYRSPPPFFLWQSYITFGTLQKEIKTLLSKHKHQSTSIIVFFFNYTRRLIAFNSWSAPLMDPIPIIYEEAFSL